MNKSLNNTQKYQRIIATNYYLNCAFHPQITDFLRRYGTSIPKLAHLRMENRTFLQEVYQSSDPQIIYKCFQKRKRILNQRAMYYSLETIYYIKFIGMIAIFITMLLNTINLWHSKSYDAHIELVVMAAVFMICLILEWRHCRICILLSKICSCASNFRITLKCDEVFESVDDILFGIDSVHYIMFEQHQIVDTINSINGAISAEVTSIIVEYLWATLPTTEAFDEVQPGLKSNFLADTDIQIDNF